MLVALDLTVAYLGIEQNMANAIALPICIGSPEASSRRAILFHQSLRSYRDRPSPLKLLPDTLHYRVAYRDFLKDVELILTGNWSIDFWRSDRGEK
ncbi:5816_t:CDS:2, partial [Acaulospora colombiana]